MDIKEERQTMRGGRRAGAGRKAKGKHGPRTSSVTIRVSRDTKDKIAYIQARGWRLASLVEAKVNDIYDLIQNGPFGNSGGAL